MTELLDGLTGNPFRATCPNTCHDCPRPIYLNDWIRAVRYGNHLWVVHDRCPT